MIGLMLVLVFSSISGSEPLNRINLKDIYKPISMLPTRRILKGRIVGDTRPYMVIVTLRANCINLNYLSHQYVNAQNLVLIVSSPLINPLRMQFLDERKIMKNSLQVYLRAAKGVNQRLIESHWLCGGVIINERHILTSAACIEDVERFYVISGTHKWIPPEVTDNECIINGAKKAIWKCIPTSHYFDGNDFDNIRWMVGDIAIVRVEDDFNFKRKILGCDFIPQKISFNNRSINHENSGTIASIAGWGATRRFIDIDKRPLQKAENSVDLLETDVIVVSKKGCTNHWDERYHDIINNQMICTKDVTDYIESNACREHGANCKLLDDLDSEYFEFTPAVPKRRMIIDPKNLIVHTAAHHRSTRRLEMSVGGFCENDHGGPLVIGQGKNAMIIGIMSACQTKDVTQKCFGPFLYTSVYKYREIIYFCSTPELGWRCEHMIRSSNSMYQETSYNWNNQPDGTQRMDSSGKLVLRSYAQTPLHPIVSSLVTENNFKSNVTATIQATTQELFKSQTEVQRKNDLNFWTSKKSEKSTMSSVINTSTQVSTLKFSLAQTLVIPVSKNSSRLTQMRKSLNHQKNPRSANISHAVSRRVTSKTNANVYMMVQDWQQNYLNYLNNM